MAHKHFIVTMEEDIDHDQAANVLAAKTAVMKDAVTVFELDQETDEADVLGIQESGIYIKAMGEDEAETLRHDERVAEVTEDIEVYALGEGRGQAADVALEDVESGDSVDPYIEGYNQALADMSDCCETYQADASARFRPPPFRPRPIPGRPVCPPGTRPVLECKPIPRPPVPERRQPIPWGIAMVKADQVWHRVTGRGVKVAVIDTGIDEDHPDLTVSGGASFVPGVSSWDDDQGHGTHCAGIAGARNNPLGVVGVAPECEFHAVKVLAGNGSGQLSWILAGMGWCVRNNMDVASMSLGSDVTDPNVGCITAYQRAARNLERSGCVVVAAAGNAGRGNNHWVGQPARCPGFLAVAAVDRNRRKANFSSWGPPDLSRLSGVEIAAPGVSIRSTLPGGGYGQKSGTSMACPHVSGAAALLKQLRPTWTPARIRNHLKATASDLGAPGFDPELGAGLLDCRRAVLG